MSDAQWFVLQSLSSVAALLVGYCAAVIRMGRHASRQAERLKRLGRFDEALATVDTHLGKEVQ